MELEVNEGHVETPEPSSGVDRLAILTEACLSLAESTKRLTEAVAVLAASEER